MSGDQAYRHSEEERNIDKNHQDIVKESIKSGFESVKQFTTLSAGSMVLIGTFLKDIFPKLGEFPFWIKLAIACALLSFVLSLLWATSFSLVGFSNMLRSKKLFAGEVSKQYRFLIIPPALLYSAGLTLFLLAVLVPYLRVGFAGNVILVGIFAVLVICELVFGILYLFLGKRLLFWLDGNRS
jgi:hypothetical protein